MTLDQLTALLATHRNQSDCVQDAYNDFTRGVVQPLATWPGEGRATITLKTWKRREWTTREAGMTTLGFESTLQNLALREPDERLLQWNLQSDDRIYIIFVTKDYQELVGCIRVMKRQDNKPSRVQIVQAFGHVKGAKAAEVPRNTD